MPEEKSVSCNSLKKKGVTESRIYPLKSEEDPFPRLSFCNMEGSDGYDDPLIETLIGYMNYMPTAEFVIFSAFKSSGGMHDGNYLQMFSGFNANHGDSFSLSSGIFKAPFKGTFQFSFAGKYETRNHDSDEVCVENGIHVMKNNELINTFTAYSAGAEYENYVNGYLTFDFSIDLEPNDEIRLKVKGTNNSGFSFESANDYHIVFSGKYIRP